MGEDMSRTDGALQPIELAVFERLGKFRKKVITLRLIEGKSLEETARACGCRVEKIKRVEQRWNFLCQKEKEQMELPGSSTASM